MKAWTTTIFSLIAIFSTISFNGFAQGNTITFDSSKLDFWFENYVKTDTEVISEDHDEFLNDLKGLITKLESHKKEQPSNRFIKKVFNKVHNRFLKKYESQSIFNDLTESGDYNCLTATALYMIVFDNLDIEFSAHEKKDHIFLVAKGKSNVIIETTDPINGYDDDRVSVNKALEAGDITRFALSFEEVLGLLYFNKAARSYVDGDLESTTENLTLAKDYYKGKRIDIIDTFVARKIKERAPN